MLHLKRIPIVLVLTFGFSLGGSIGNQDAEQLQCERLDATCKFSSEYESHEKPLVVNPLKHSIRDPGETKEYNLYKDNYIYLQCLGNNNTFARSSEYAFLRGKSFIKASCVCGESFESECKTYNLNNLKCVEPNQVDIVKTELKKTYQNTKFYERLLRNTFSKYQIGATIADLFEPSMDIIYHSDTCSTIYSRTTTKKNLQQDTNVSMLLKDVRYDFACSNFNYNLHYDEETQEKSFEYQNVKNGVIEIGTDYIFIPIYLTPPDFLPYMLGRLVSNFQINMAPQWKIISQGNWAATNDFVYDFTTKFDATIITGVFGSLQLQNSTRGKSDPLVLYKDSKGKQEIDIPLYFVKIVHTKDYKMGSAFVTVNNPYVSKNDYDEYVDELCKKPYYAYKQPAWDLNYTAKPNYFYPKGYSLYCCIDDFLKRTDFPYEDEQLPTVKKTIPVIV